jgi:hypothetical protein
MPKVIVFALHPKPRNPATQGIHDAAPAIQFQNLSVAARGRRHPNNRATFVLYDFNVVVKRFSRQ